MNNLQKLIKLRGLTVLDISRKIGHGYHNTQKVIKGSQYKRKDGSVVTRSSLPIENAVAAQLGLTHDQAWGAKSHTFLQRLILKEIKALAKAEAKKQESDLQRQFLPKNRVPEKRACCNV